MEQELVCPFQNLQTGMHFPSRLIVFIKHYLLSVSQVSPPALSHTRLAGRGLTHWFCASGCYPKRSRNDCYVCGSHLATSNLGSQAAELTETVPAGADLLPWFNHLVGLGPKGW